MTLELIFVFFGGIPVMGSTIREAEHRQEPKTGCVPHREGVGPLRSLIQYVF